MSQPLSQPAATPASAPTAELYHIDGQTLAAFDAAVNPFELDKRLQDQIVGNELGDSMAALVDSLRKLSFERLTRKFGWLDRLTGADLQARIEFDLAAHFVSQQIDAAYTAARRAQAMLETLHGERTRLTQLAPRHEELLTTAEALLRGQNPQDEFVARFQRRAANLAAMCSANRLSEAQLDLTIKSLTAQLDRFGELRKLLLPAWQQHALAIAQAASGSTAEYQELNRFQAASTELAECLDKQGA
ncbi:hypothetical protein [Novosphingobium sp. B 225]|uniref:hypothetical protein n=1 Tax=Novosphingobium sp. B 225 TaxID=1961849 RepID=UPI000B4BFC7D|nr:hypothetical protein [Novosphingobium sp. B 225]